MSAEINEGTVAKSDVTVVDHRGLPVQIIAGTEVPAHLVSAYEDASAAGDKPARQAKAKPATDKAKTGPDAAKADDSANKA